MVADRRISERRDTTPERTPAEEAQDNVRGGRKALPETERRSIYMKFRVNAAERAQIHIAAETVGLGPTVFMRELALGYKPKPNEAHDAARVLASLNQIVLELQRQGNNLNQLSRSVHTDTAFQQHWREIGQEVKVLTATAQLALARLLDK